jgi:hypothetical protein
LPFNVRNIAGFKQKRPIEPKLRNHSKTTASAWLNMEAR